MRNWRVLSWLLSLCIIFGLFSGVAYADDSFTNSGHGGGWDNENVTYYDTGLGWYCNSWYLTTHSNTLILGTDNDTWSSKDDTPVICAYMLQYDEDDINVGRFVIIISTDPNAAHFAEFPTSGGFSFDYGGLRWYYSSSCSMGGYFTNDDLRTDMRTAEFIYDESIWENDLLFAEAVLGAAGVTTDPSVLIPPESPEPAKTHVIESVANPYVVNYRSNTGSKQFVTLDDTYQVANRVTNVVFSDSLNAFNNDFSAIPSDNGVLARYICYRPVSISASDFQYAHVTGEFYFRAGVSGETNLHIYDMNLLVNGERIGSKHIKFYNTALGGKITVNENIPLSAYGDITSLGIYASFDGTYNGLQQTSSEHGAGFGDGVSSGRSDAPDSFEWYFHLADNLAIEGSATAVVEPSETPVDPIDTIEETTGNIFSWVRDIFNAILDLPKLLLDGIKNLFVPSQDSILAIKAKYENLLAERLGFLWQVKQFIGNFFGDFLSALQGSNSYVFQFPGISFPMNGDLHQLVSPQTISLENDFMDVVRPVVGTIVSIVCVLAFFNTSFDMVAAWISGVSYFDFLKRGGGEG